MLDLLFSDPYSFIFIFGGIIIAIGIHEAAHCYMADYLGDPTPRSQGRLTLNPLAHLDPMGTLVILITGRFGWGKPSPFDPYNLKNPKRDTALIAIAGPVSNLLLATLLSFIPFASIQPLIILNVSLAIFNLIPIPPLDGSKLLPTRYQNIPLSQSLILIILLLLPLFNGLSLASIIVFPIVTFILRLLGIQI